MNPQQFQQMGGMGRGMQPNNMQQMNQLNQFQMNAQMANQMNGQMAGQMNMPIQGQIPGQMNAGMNQMQKHIFQSLQNQGLFEDWQGTVSMQERAAQVKQLVDSLRLVRPPVELPRAVEVALQFERKCFTQSPSKEIYFKECSEKLGRIRDQRAQQLNQQAGVMQHGMQIPDQTQPFAQQMQMNQNQTINQMAQGMGQNMAPNMGQNMTQNMGQNMVLPNHMQQQMQSSPMFNQQRPQNMMNPQMMQSQMMSNQLNQMNQQKQLPELTAEDNKIINLRAAELAKSTPKDEMRNIVDKMDPRLRQNLQAKSVDPIIYYFRMRATREFRQRKAIEAAGNMGQAGNIMQMQQNQQNQQNQPFMNEMGRYQGLQAEGLRSQETGELVVPASNTQTMLPEQLRLQQQMLANQRMGQQNQANNMNPAFLAQQQRLQQANKMQQAAQFQAQSQQARAQVTNQAQPGQAQQPQSNTPMPMLNTPVQNVQGTSPQQGNRPGVRTPMLGQQQGQMNQQPANIQDMQRREQALNRFPPHIANILRQKPQNEWQAVLQEIGQNNAMRRSMSQQPHALQQGQQPQQQPQMQNGAFLGGANIGPSPMQQSLSTGAMGTQGNDMTMMPGTPQQGQMQANQEMLRQRQAQMQQQQQQRMQGEQANLAQGQQPQQQARPLNPNEMKVMDTQPVPPNVLNNIRQHTQLPNELRTWHALKQFAMSNPIQGFAMSALMTIQANHFAHMMRARRAAAGNMPPGGMPGQMTGQMQQQQQQLPQQQQQQPQPQPQPQQQQQQQQQPQKLQQPQQQQPQQRPQQPQQSSQIPQQRPQPQVQTVQSMNAMQQQPQLKPPTMQDIQKIRAANPKLQNMTDEQVRTLFIQRQKQLQAQAMQQQATQGQGHQAFVPQIANQPQAANQLPVQLQAQQAQARASQQQQQLQQQQSAAPSQAKQLPPQQEKGVKRGNDEDVVEVSNNNLPVPKPAQAQPNTRFQQLTREQFNALDPVKQQQYMKYQRQHTAINKIFEMTKEIQNTMPKLRPLNLDANSRRRLMALLTSDNVRNMLGRFDQFLLAYHQMEQNDVEVKKLIMHRFQLFPQYKTESLNNKTFIPIDNPTISPETAEGIINNITAKFQHTAAQIPKAPAQLTPENLSRLDAQEQERKKSVTKASNVPPAPTTSQPPFQFGDARGQGTPRYGTPGLKQEDLKLPADPKRRKKNPPAPSTPNRQSSTANTSPQQAKPAPPTVMYKCSNKSCDYHTKGFATQAELDVHTATAHKPAMEYIADPIAFLDSSLRTAFNLDENFKQIKKPQVSQSMEKITSKTGTVTNLKVESKPATPTPMVKQLSQAGQMSSPAVPKFTPEKDKLVPPPTAEDDGLDDWKHSNISLDELNAVFGDFDYMEDLVPTDHALEIQDKFLENYRQSEAWQKIIKGPEGSLTETPTDKSTSPPLANGDDKDTSDKKVNAESSTKAEDDFTIDLLSIPGLDITKEELDALNWDDTNDIAMNEKDSPFELVEFGDVSEEDKQIFLKGGVDITKPDSLTESQKIAVNSWLEPW